MLRPRLVQMLYAAEDSVALRNVCLRLSEHLGRPDIHSFPVPISELLVTTGGRAGGAPVPQQLLPFLVNVQLDAAADTGAAPEAGPGGLPDADLQLDFRSSGPQSREKVNWGRGGGGGGGEHHFATLVFGPNVANVQPAWWRCPRSLFLADLLLCSAGGVGVGAEQRESSVPGAGDCSAGSRQQHGGRCLSAACGRAGSPKLPEAHDQARERREGERA